MKKYLPIIIPLLIISSCSHPEKSQKESKSKDNKVNFVEITLEETDPFEPNFEVEKYVALEVTNDSYFANINKLLIRNDIIYIMDAFVKKKVFAFDNEGNFIRSYGAIGNAPGEYQRLTDFDVAENGNVQILDRQQKKIHFYDKMGKFQTSKNTEFRAEAFKLLEDGYLFSLVPYSMGSNLSAKIIKTDFQFNILKSHFNYSSEFKDLKGDFNILKEAGEEVLYHKPVNDTIFKFNSNGVLMEGINIDFGNKQVPQELKNDYALLSQRQNNSDFLFFNQPPILFKNLLVGQMYERGQNGILYIDLENGKSKRKLLKPHNMDHTMMEFPIYNWNDSLLISCTYIDFMENDQNKSLFPDEFYDYIKKHNGAGLIFSSLNSN